jgi:hypothetical protein
MFVAHGHVISALGYSAGNARARRRGEVAHERPACVQRLASRGAGES